MAERMEHLSLTLQRSPLLKGRAWYFIVAVNILTALVLSLILVWVSIERMDINYFINLEQVELRDKLSLHGKLQVEKERLLSPYELRLKAEKLGMKPPKPGQIRRVELKKQPGGGARGTVEEGGAPR